MATKESNTSNQKYRHFLKVDVAWPPSCPDDILEGAINETLETLKKYNIDRDGPQIVEHLKKYCDTNFEPSWHVFFGKNFGCHATHEKGSTLEKKAIFANITATLRAKDFSDMDSDDEFSRNSISYLGHSILKDSIMSSKAFYEQSERSKKERIKRVRKQEADISKRELERKRKEDSLRSQEEEKQKKFLEYQKLKEEKKRLEDLLEDSYINIGKAQRDAEQVEIKRFEEQKRKAEKQLLTHNLTQQREKEAIEWRQREEEERVGPYQEILLRKQIVKDEETKLAHKLAEEQKEKIRLEQERLQSMKKPDSYLHVDRAFGKKTLVTKQNVDFSQTHFHNPVIVKHDPEDQNATALENAVKEKEKSEKRIKEKAQLEEQRKKTQRERSLLATEREKGKKAVETLNKELDEIALRERKKRLANSKANEIGDFAGPVKKKYDELRSRNQIEEDFEKEFMVQDKKPSPERLPEKFIKDGILDSDLKRSFISSKRTESEEKENHSNSANKIKGFKEKASKKCTQVHLNQRSLSSVSPGTGNQRVSSQTKKVLANKKDLGAEEKLNVEKDEVLNKRLEEIDSRLDHLGKKKVYDKKLRTTSKEIPDEGGDELENLVEKIYEVPQNKERERVPVNAQKSVKFAEQREIEDIEEKNFDFLANKDLITPNFNNISSKNRPSAKRPEGKEESTINFQEFVPKKENLLSLTDNLIKESEEIFGKKPKPTSKFADKPIEEASLKHSTANDKADNKASLGDIEEYLKEQEEFLARLDQDRNKLAKKLREEEARSKLTLESNKRGNETMGRLGEVKVGDNQAEKIIENYKKINNGYGNSSDLESKTNALFNKFLKKGNESEGTGANIHSKFGSSSAAIRKDEDWGFDDRFELADSQPLRDGFRKAHTSTTPLKQSLRDNNIEGTPFSELSYSISELESKSAEKRMEDLNAESSLKKSWKSNLDASDSLRYSQSVAGALQSRKAVQNDNKILIENQNDSSRNSERSEDFKKAGKSSKGVRLDFDLDEGTREEREAGIPLAEIFKKRKANFAKKLEENQKRKQEKEENEYNLAEEPKKRTKEEILQQRKEMMKRPDFLKSRPTASDSNEQETQSVTVKFNDKKGNSKEPNPELLERLALGKKSKVGKKEMLALTSKNYELLPEIKKRKDEEKKKEDLKKRKEKAKELSEKLRGKKN